jgi:hypothetical protein
LIGRGQSAAGARLPRFFRLDAIGMSPNVSSRWGTEPPIAGNWNDPLFSRQLIKPELEFVKHRLARCLGTAFSP